MPMPAHTHTKQSTSNPAPHIARLFRCTGLADGRSVVHNIKFDETLVSFSHAQGGAVSSIAFRSDQTPTLATGSTSGQISVWDLEKKKLVTIIKDAHNAPVSSLRFLPREPVMVTASDDNTLKMWIFDQPDGTARLLRSRSGHSGAPDRVRFYKDARAMLSSSREDQSLRATFTFRDQMNRELSQRNLEHRAKKFHVDEQSLRLYASSSHSLTISHSRYLTHSCMWMGSTDHTCV